MSLTVIWILFTSTCLGTILVAAVISESNSAQPIWSRELKLNFAMLVVTCVAMIGSLSTVYLSQASLNDARQATAEQMRAYVLFDKAKIISLDNGNYRIEIRIRNGGQTPAYYVTNWWDYKFVDEEVLVDAHFPFSETGLVSQDISPQTSALLDEGRKIEITDRQKVSIEQGSTSIFVWSSVKYLDFRNRCQFATFRLRNGLRVSNGWNLKIAEGGNYATNPYVKCNNNSKAISPRYGEEKLNEMTIN